MELDNQKRLSKHIFRLLKINVIQFPIGRTNKGNLSVKFDTSNDDYEIMLDAVPLKTTSIIDDENNIELKRMIEKYWFENKIPTVSRDIFNALSSNPSVTQTKEQKKRGRPKDSKGKKK